MSDAPELLPCPFCGSEAEADYRQPFWHYATGKTGYQAAIYCHGCPVNLALCYDDYLGTNPDALMAELVAAWNRRAALFDHPTVKALVAEAEARGMERAVTTDPASAFNRADWFWRAMDPDDCGDSPEEAINRAMVGRFCVCEIASSYAGPTRYGFIAPVLDPESDDEEFVHFATQQEAIDEAKRRAEAAAIRGETT